ncbi:MAG: TIM barrel protein [Planctomycetia bacterium]|nr:TIM barrel protein [Planctomycetia bacterium]
MRPTSFNPQRPSFRTAAVLLATLGMAAAAPGAVPDRLGVAAWTFHDVTFLEAIEKAGGLGLTRIEAFESQKLAPDDVATVAGDLSAAQIARIRGALEKHGLTLTSIYIHSIPGDEAAARKIFERVKRLGAGMIVGEPKARDLDVIEPLCEEYSIDLALHNHPDDGSEYRDPKHLATVLASHGKRIGSCCDIGHWQRRGIDTVKGLETLAGRVLGVHLKDLDAARPDGHDVPWGTGVGRVADVLAELGRQESAPRIIAVEYEYNVGKSLPEIARCVAFFRSAVAGLSPEGAGELLAGWATGDLTPNRPTTIFGQFGQRVSQGVRDPLTCTALALETRRDGKPVDQAVMVSVDLAFIHGGLNDAVAALYESIAARAPGIDVAKIVLNATHTHTAPSTEDGWYAIPPGVMQPAEYRAWAAERIAEAVVAAWNARQPASTSWALTHAVVAHNRRAVYFDQATGRAAAGRTALYGETNTADFDSIEGPADTALSLAFFWQPDGTLSGLIVNLPCPSQETEHLSELSADFWHETRIELRKRLGDGIFILPQCAAGGDCVSRPMLRKGAEEEMRRRRGLSGREEIARRIADAVSDVMPHAKAGVTATPILRHAVRTLDLPMRIVTMPERDRAKIQADSLRNDPGMGRKWHSDVVRRYDEQQAALSRGDQPTTPVGVHAIRLGDVAFVTNCFEMFGDYGTRIQARSPATLTCVVQLAGRGVHSYLPTARGVEGGGYSAIVQSSWVGPEGGRLLVDESVRMLQQLWAKPVTDSATTTSKEN